MKKIFGFDLGTASIGWAVVTQNDNRTFEEILGMGVRIVKMSPDEKANFEKGTSVTTNQTRRQKRGARRNQSRYKMRRDKLNRIIQRLGIEIPASLLNPEPEFVYALRARGVTEQLSLAELARTWQLINQKRGFLSNRKSPSEDEKDTNYVATINSRAKELREQGLTIGQYHHQHIQASVAKHGFCTYLVKTKIFPRSEYKAEFDTIWNQQKTFYPELLTDELYKEVCLFTIFFQRPLKSQKSKVSKCRYEPNARVAPKSSPLFQMFRIWQTVNNLRAESADKETIIPTREQMVHVFWAAMEKDKLSTSELLKILALPKKGYDLNIDKSGGLKGNSTHSRIKAALEKGEVSNRAYFLSFDYKATDYTNQPLYKLWHLLYSAENDDDLIKTLTDKEGLYKFSPEQAEILARVRLEPDYGSLSAKAMRNLLPFLEQGMRYDEACTAYAGQDEQKKLYLKHSDFLNNEENLERQLLEIHQLQVLKKGALRNPVVEKILNQFIHVFKAMVLQYGRPDEVRIELARELKMNAKNRANAAKKMAERERYKKAIEAKLKEHPFFKSRRITKKFIEKYMLWEEFGHASPFEPNKLISLEELFNDNYEIEHIIPKALQFDDSFGNKTIASRAVNQEKNNRTAYDYMASKGEQKLEEYLQFLHMHKDKLTKTKLANLKMSQKDLVGGFINRQLNESQYIAKSVRSIIEPYVRKVTATSGSVTDYLREKWEYINVLEELNYPLYEPVGLVETVMSNPDTNGHQKPMKRIKDWTKRDDQRHHALDALVIACTSQGIIQSLNNLHQTLQFDPGKNKHDQLRDKDFATIRPFKRDIVREKLQDIFTAYKSGQKTGTPSQNKAGKQTTLTPRGQLHQETVYGQNKVMQKVPLDTKFKLEWLDQMAHEPQKLVVQARLKQYANNPRLAFKDLGAEPLLLGQKAIKEVTIFENVFVIRTSINENFKPEHADKILDPVIKAAVKARLAQFGGDSKKAFQALAENPIYADDKRTIPIKSVRMLARPNELESLHTNQKGQRVDFVSPSNNHHVAFYLDEKGAKQEYVVSFWHAFERKRQGLPVVNPEPFPGWQLLGHIESNEMVVFELNPEEVDFFNPANRSLISQYLYRVQKFSSMYFVFRHHLETRIVDDNRTQVTKRFRRLQSLKSATWTKVRLDHLGNIVDIKPLP